MSLRTTDDEWATVVRYAQQHKISNNTAICEMIHMASRLIDVATAADLLTHPGTKEVGDYLLNPDPNRRLPGNPQPPAPAPAASHPTVRVRPAAPRAPRTRPSAPGPLFREPPSAPEESS